jgi:alkylation response protein AidB-like acyl-CoA dehydrogenase
VVVPSGRRAGFLDQTVADVLTRPQASRSFSGRAVPARQLVAIAAERGTSDDPRVRQELARYWSLTEINRVTQLRARAAGAGPPSTDATTLASLTKLMISGICRASRQLVFRVMGPAALLAGADAPYRGEAHDVALGSFGASLGGGTDEIQRNLLGERVLGLPREPAVDRDVPYRELRVGTERPPRATVTARAP